MPNDPGARRRDRSRPARLITVVRISAELGRSYATPGIRRDAAAIPRYWLLQLWYDDPLPDAGHRPFAVRYIEELKGIHWSVSLTRIKTDICLGRHREVIAELEELTRQRPNEGEVWMLRAIALYRSDRIPEAVEVCQLAIAAREGKGIEARRLQDLQHAILTETAPVRGPLGRLTAKKR